MTNNLPIETVSSLESTDALDMYLAELRKTPLLSKEEELELFHKLNESDDLDAARKLVMAHLRFVVHVAKTYKGYGLPLLDIIQEGNVGLMKAVKRFDSSKNVRLLSFAIYWIRAEIHEFVFKNWRIVKVATTKAQRKLFFKLRSKKSKSTWLTQSEKNAIASELNVNSDAITTMESRLSGTDVCFDPVTEDDLSPSEYLTDEADPLLKLEYEQDGQDESKKLYEAMSVLDKRSKDIITSRYLSEKKTTLEQLAKKYNVSIERIRQIENKTLDSLKNNLIVA
ncbi:MAG: RNA polymerase sigma factor RpoH [Gammaproteobacteria bacterium]|nr:RNA polymerase sigma factor RpoH [Gammaproteobacteria bacterium]|tara:strand:- start:377 stop:1222 length:846 start_codon:yes stop_codon:yes gene_type:complete